MPKATDQAYEAAWYDIPIVIEAEEGEERYGKVLPCDYGFVRATESAEGALEQMDVMVSNYGRPTAWVADLFYDDGDFNEHKILLGHANEAAARDDLEAVYPGQCRALTHMTQSELRDWLNNGDPMQPLAA